MTELLYIEENNYVLRTNFPLIYEQLSGLHIDCMDYECILSQSGLQTMRRILDGKEYYVHSRYDPIKEAMQWVNHISNEVRNAEYIFVYGFGLGYHIRALLELFPDKKLFVYEPDLQLFALAVKHVSLVDIFMNDNLVVLGVGEDDLVQHQMISNALSIIINSFAFTVIPSYRYIYKEHFSSFENSFVSLVNVYRCNLATKRIFAQDWIRNVMFNWSNNLRSRPIVSLKNIAKGMPIAVIGSGPSARIDKQYMEDLSKKAIIIAAGSSILWLLKEGIKPDFLCIIDGSEKNYEIFKNLDFENIYTLYGNNVNYKIPDAKKEKMFYYYTTDDDVTEWVFDNKSDIPKFVTASSVTGDAIQAAIYMGASKIILVGQDFSYPNNDLYTSGVNHFSLKEQEKYVESVAQFTVPAVNDGTNPTSRAMMTTLTSIEFLIAASSGIAEFINTSQIGAVIKGTKQLNMKVLLSELSEQLDKSKFYEKLNETHLNNYHDIRIGQLIEKKINIILEDIRGTKEALSELNMLMRTIEQNMDDLELLPKVFNKWSIIVEKEIFTHIYAQLHDIQIDYFKRNLPLFSNATSSELLQEYTIKYLYPLTTIMEQSTDSIITMTEQSLNRVVEVIQKELQNATK